jgi:hypothetical protein
LLAALGKIGDRRYLEPCKHLLLTGGLSSGVRVALIRALGHIASASDRPWYLTWSRYVDPFGPSPLLAVMRRRQLW